MKKIGKWFSYIILTLVVVFFVFALLVPVVFSGEFAIVRSSSMEPAMPAGALALMLPVDPEKIVVGDIITFKPSWDLDVTVSHRVIEILHDGQLLFDTKGDAMEGSDPYYVSAENVYGKVVFNIPYLGFLVNGALKYINTWWGFCLMVVMPSVILFGSTVMEISRSRCVRAKRMKNWQKRQRWHKKAYKLLA